MNFSRTTQLTLSLGGFLGQDMALERLRTFDASASTHNKAFFCTAFCLHFRHNNSIYLMTPGGL
jgi:hypothetical protein